MRAFLNGFVALLALCLPVWAFAHASSQAYLDLRPAGDGVQLRAELALRDLDELLDLDADADGLLRWGELRPAAPAIERLLREGLQLRGCAARWQAGPLQLLRRGDGVYAAIEFRVPCAMPAEAPLRYALLATLDPTHRALLRWTPSSGAPARLLLLNPTAPEEPPAMNATPAALLTLAALSPLPAQAAAPSFVWEGVVHLVTGYDHLLFLACLLLPAVLLRRPGGWVPVQRPREALLPVVGVVTAFTLAHSLTLALATLGHLRIPATVVEPLIAASIVLAAIDNLFPLKGDAPRAGAAPARPPRGWSRLGAALRRLRNTPRWAVAFGFGLIHGFGFAGVLGELELPAGELAWALLAFNLGLEAAQLAVVLLAIGLLWALRRWPGYPRWVLQLGSSLAALMGGVWVLQRVG